MFDILWSPAGQVILSLTILCILIAISVYILSKIRPKSIQQEHDSKELLSKFRESLSEGELSEEEYREIRTTLAKRIHEESIEEETSD